MSVCDAMQSNGVHHIVSDAEHFDHAMGIIGDRIEGLCGEVHELRTHQAEAMAAALRSVLTDKETLASVMDIVVTTAQKRAAEKTGNAVGAMLKSLLTRWVLIGCIVVLVAKTAGVDVAGKVWASLKGLP